VAEHVYRADRQQQQVPPGSLALTGARAPLAPSLPEFSINTREKKARARSRGRASSVLRSKIPKTSEPHRVEGRGSGGERIKAAAEARGERHSGTPSLQR